MLENPFEISNKPIQKITIGQLDIKLRQFMEEKTCHNIKQNKKEQRRISSEVSKTRKSENINLGFCLQIYAQKSKIIYDVDRYF